MRHLIQIYSHAFHNNLIITVTKGIFYGAYIREYKLFTSNTPISKYKDIHINLTRKRNNTTSECETCIVSMLLQ